MGQPFTGLFGREQSIGEKDYFFYESTQLPKAGHKMYVKGVCTHKSKKEKISKHQTNVLPLVLLAMCQTKTSKNLRHFLSCVIGSLDR